MKTVLVAVLLAASTTVAYAEDRAAEEARLLDRLVSQPASSYADPVGQHRRGRRLRIAGHVTLGVSLAVLSAGMAAEGAFVAQDFASGLGDNCGPGCRPDNLVVKEALAGTAMGIGALGALAGGLVLKMGVDEGRADVSLAPQASNTGGGVSLRARF